MRDEVTERALVVLEARTWCGTPYHHHAGVRGAGVDCAQLILRAFAGAGIVEDFDPGPYTHDWHMHRSEERYLEAIEQRCRRVDDCELPLTERPADLRPDPADIVVFRHGRTYSHGGIVSQWPMIIHASYPAGCVLEEAVTGTLMARKPMRVYSHWRRP